MRPLIRRIQELMEGIEPGVTVIEIHPLRLDTDERRMSPHPEDNQARNSTDELRAN
jgi:predicted nuclease with RNAse H fold